MQDRASVIVSKSKLQLESLAEVEMGKYYICSRRNSKTAES
ncbi:MAG: hypothetical protein ACP5RP_02230 [Candidatus Micrarchaeia archaeon]